MTADWHMRSKPPVARSGEKDWFDTQKGYLRQVGKIASGAMKLPGLFDQQSLPILLAGDVFDRHNPNPELINFLLDHMPPNVHAVPGNHDLQNQRYDDLPKSGYYTLAAAGRVKDLQPEFAYDVTPRIRVWPFPWGVEPKPCPEPHDLYIEVALVHKYLWVKGNGYQGAPEDARIGNVASRFKGYDVVVSGDNHVPFTVRKNGTLFVNCGSLMRLTADQRDYRPAVWVLYDDLTVEPKYLDVSKDDFQTGHLLPDAVGNADVFGLIESIRNAHDTTVDFDEAVNRVIRKGHLSEEVLTCLKGLLEDGQ